MIAFGSCHPQDPCDAHREPIYRGRCIVDDMRALRSQGRLLASLAAFHKWALAVVTVLKLALTFAVPGAYADTIVLDRDFGIREYRPDNLTPGTVIDARKARWVVDNCGWAGPKNAYPVQIENAREGKLIGGIVTSRIPQRTEWSRSYCNSAAMMARKDSQHFTFDGVRVDGAWDGIRFAAGDQSRGVVENVWLTNIRDDCIENDQLATLTVRDSLLDGCFVGISIDPGAGGAPDNFESDTLIIDGVLMRIKAYPFKSASEIIPGSFIKPHDSSPAIAMKNSILAFDSTSKIMIRRMTKAWSKMKSCSNNTLLWLSDEPFPGDFPMPPPCFEIVKGQQAWRVWNDARADWLARHPEVGRLETDPAAGPDSASGRNDLSFRAEKMLSAPAIGC